MSALASVYSSFSGTMQVAQSIASELIPYELRSYITSAVRQLFTPHYHIIIIDEHHGMTRRNPVFEAAELYLSDKFSRAAARLRVARAPREEALSVFIDQGQKFDDVLDDNIKLSWRFIHTERNQGQEKRYFELSFHKKFKDRVLDSYLPSVLIQANDIKERQKAIKIYSRKCPYSDQNLGVGRHGWGFLNLEHPSTFETLALDPELKKKIVEDLDRFVRRKEFYKKVGKAWKRGYLLYGPTGTGKTSLIAAMANYLKFDIYDLELTSIYNNSDLRSVLLSTTNRSILVIEDIDCSVDLQNRLSDEHFLASATKSQKTDTKMTLSGLLNFIDGLWSCCGDERIIVFTTNHKDRLDPALLRPGRMDMHINMSYCTPHSFKTLASNYLGVHGDHRLCHEIEGLISGGTQVSPAEVAEEFMKSEDKDVALEGLVNLLKRKSVEMIETREKESAEAAVVMEGVVNFLQQKKAESVKKKDKESLDAIGALEELVDLVRQKKIEAGGVLRKDQEGVDEDEGSKSKRLKTTEKRTSVRKGSKV